MMDIVGMPCFGVRGLAPAFSSADLSKVGHSPRRVAASKSGDESPHSERRVRFAVVRGAGQGLVHRARRLLGVRRLLFAFPGSLVSAHRPSSGKRALVKFRDENVLPIGRVDVDFQRVALKGPRADRGVTEG